MQAWVARSERAAFELLFQRHAQRLHGFFLRSVGDDAVAQDLVQQTFLHLHRARADWRPDRPLRPWLTTIAVNLRRELYRRRQRKPEAALDPDRHPEPSVAPSVSTPQQLAVRRALAGLPDGQREVVLLHWYEGWSFPEIAERLGASTSAVKVRAHRAYEALRVALTAFSQPPAPPRHPTS